MNTLLVYSSKTGNTKKLVDYISTLDKNLEIKESKETVDYTKYNNIILAGWILMGTFDKETLEVVKKLKNKKIGFFFTMTGYPTSSHAYSCANNIIKLLEKENEVIDFFWSQGPLTENYMKSILSRPKEDPYYPKEAKIKRWDIAARHPNYEDEAVAKSFYEQYLAKIKEN